MNLKKNNNQTKYYNKTNSNTCTVDGKEEH